MRERERERKREEDKDPLKVSKSLAFITPLIQGSAGPKEEVDANHSCYYTTLLRSNINFIKNSAFDGPRILG